MFGPPGLGVFSDAVQGTTDDASTSKLSAVTAGYYEDPYVAFFVKRPTRRSPLINRGYYSRVATVRLVVETFLKAVPPPPPRNDVPIPNPPPLWRKIPMRPDFEPHAQVVNLGAGLDTLAFWLPDLPAAPPVVVFEIDFPEVVVKKTAVVLQRKELWSKIHYGPKETLITNGSSLLMTERLRTIPGDLRELRSLQPHLLTAGFRDDLPTLFISECVLVYVQSLASDKIIAWCSGLMKASATFFIYEQINPHDPFGRTMVHNLEMRGSPLMGIHDYPTLRSQCDRFKKLGWPAVSFADMNEVYDSFLDRSDVFRIQRLELFDEIEEWRLIQSHYFAGVAVKGPLGAAGGANPMSAVPRTTPQFLDLSSRSIPSSPRGSRKSRGQSMHIDEEPCPTVIVESDVSDEALGCLAPVAHLWADENRSTQPMPRFTTEQLRSLPNTPVMGVVLSPAARPAPSPTRHPPPLDARRPPPFDPLPHAQEDEEMCGSNK